MQDANAIPSPWLRRIPMVLVLVLAAFGALVEVRSCFIERRMGDLTVFVRTAWAVRSGEDIYDVADEKGFHYQYAPLLGDPHDAPRRSTGRRGSHLGAAVPGDCGRLVRPQRLLLGDRGPLARICPGGARRRLDGRAAITRRALVVAAAGAGAGLSAADRAHADARASEPAAAAAALRHGDGDAARATSAIGFVAGRRHLSEADSRLPALYPLVRRDGRCLAGCAWAWSWAWV